MYFPLRTRLLDALEAGGIPVSALVAASDDELLERIGVGAVGGIAQGLLAD